MQPSRCPSLCLEEAKEGCMTCKRQFEVQFTCSIEESLLLLLVRALWLKGVARLLPCIPPVIYSTDSQQGPFEISCFTQRALLHINLCAAAHLSHL